jgi:hypothetical protein
LEKENTIAQNIYWIEEGEIFIYKKIDHIYEYNEYHPNNKKLICMNYVRPLDLFHNPKDGPFASIGVCLGSFSEKDSIVGEDSGFFK